MNKFEEKYKLLNSQQKAAVDAIEGPVLVVAGPGSGKTEVIGLRVGNILKNTDVFPGNILCLTFTDHASITMRERLRELMGQDAHKVAIYTFHNFGVDIINYHPEIFYKGAVFSSADELTQLSLLEDIFSGFGYDNPLKKTHPEQGYTYLRPVKKAIQYLKKAGITPEEFEKILNHNEEALEFLNPLLGRHFNATVNKKMFEILPGVVEEIRNYKMREFPLAHMQSLLSSVADSLEKTLEKARESEKTKPLSEWKRERMHKSEEGQYLLKESKYLEKMRALAGAYKQYRHQMHSRGYYDFDDMILDVLTAIEENSELKYELQEQFQYILVDEFQDTNDAQMRLLRLLTSSPAAEGRPNIMAVGDDDQAIFKFQGAEVSNILKFKDYYRDPKIITLAKNYRSRQDILDVARYIITQGDERLEALIPNIDKALKAENFSIAKGDIVSKSFRTRSHECNWIAEEIKRLIKGGVEAKDIAVIARKHDNLKFLIPYLDKLEIPFSYESKRDALKEPHIKQLIQMARFTNSLLKNNEEEANELLPEILSYPFWNIERQTIWKLSRRAYKERKPWMEVMLSFSQKKIRDIANFFLNLAAQAQYEPVDKVLDKMVGAKTHSLPESEQEEVEETKKKEKEEFISPFKEYYFSDEKFKNNPGQYLTFLSGLRTFIYALREYRQGEDIGLQDMLDFVQMHKDNNMSLSDNSTFLSDRNGVNLLSAHKAKGTEFDTVFVLNCQDGIWAGRKQGSRLPFPHNLPITPAGDNKDDQLRLFYVAVTRAVRRLYLTSYQLSDAGKELSRLQFIAPPAGDESKEVKKLLEPQSEEDRGEPKKEMQVIASSWETYHYPPFCRSEQALLESILEDYKLNVTHINNFLNVAQGGPQLFLEQNLLRFPQPKSASLSYGTAMHETIHQIYQHLKTALKLPTEKQIEEWFEKFLQRERMNKNDFNSYLKRGVEALKVFFREKKDEFKKGDLSEFDFRQEGVVIEDAPVTGKIDRMEFDGSEAIVTDFKTGKSTERWKGRDSHEKIKLWKYKNQLIFYKILVENSRRFGGGYEVNQGIVEFLEPKDKQKIISLSLTIGKEEVERFKEIIKAVYEKVTNLDFPKIDKYDSDIKGIKQFEEDLRKRKES